jgi:plastocyanin
MRRLLAVTALGALILTGCSGSSSKTSTGATTTTGGGVATTVGKLPVAMPGPTNDRGTKAAAEGLAVDAEDFSFNPTFVKATAAQRFTIEVANKGKATHTFTSAALGVDQQLAPGQRKAIQIVAPASGNAEFHCRFHQGQGMQGAVYVG